jgi:hypothetical protein
MPLVPEVSTLRNAAAPAKRNEPTLCNIYAFNMQKLRDLTTQEAPMPKPSLQNFDGATSRTAHRPPPSALDVENSPDGGDHLRSLRMPGMIT